LVSILPNLYSESLDRLKMWDRIGNGITTAVAKCGGDLEMFVDCILEFIKADSAAVVRNSMLEKWLIVAEQMDQSDKVSMLKILEKKKNVILVYARNQYRAIKDANRPLKEGE